MMSEFGSKVLRDRADRWLLAVAALLAPVCAGLALLIDTATWTNWFHHPGRHPLPEETVEGARLWRAMLGVSAVAMVACGVALVGLNRGGANETQGVLSRKRLWWLIGIVIVALAFRVTRWNESLWYDEIASWMTYSAGVESPGPVIGNFRDPVNQVFHTLLNFYSVRWFVDRMNVELAFRLPALLFSLISVVAMYGLGRAAAGERVGLIAAILAAVLPVSVLEGVEARSYSMMICFSALMMWTFIEAKRRQRAWIWALYSISCALGIWAHFVTAFVPIGHAAWAAWRAIVHRETKFAISALIALALGAILTITLYAPIIPDMLSAREMFAAESPDQPRILSAEGLHALLQLGGSWYWWATIPGLLLLVFGAQSLRRRNRETASMVAISLAGLPLMLSAVIIAGTWIYARFTLFALPGAMLLVALGVDVLWNRSRVLGTVALVVTVIASAADLYVRPPKQPLRNAAEYVRGGFKPGESIVIVGLAHPVMRIYINDLNPSYSFMHGRDLEAQLDQLHPTWVIVEYPWHGQDVWHPVLHERGYGVQRPFRGWADWKHGDVFVMRRNDAP